MDIGNPFGFGSIEGGKKIEESLGALNTRRCAIILDGISPQFAREEGKIYRRRSGYLRVIIQLREGGVHPEGFCTIVFCGGYLTHVRMFYSYVDMMFMCEWSEQSQWGQSVLWASGANAGPQIAGRKYLQWELTKRIPGREFSTQMRRRKHKREDMARIKYANSSCEYQTVMDWVIDCMQITYSNAVRGRNILG
jgi:hypothetical protein